MKRTLKHFILLIIACAFTTSFAFAHENNTTITKKVKGQNLLKTSIDAHIKSDSINISEKWDIILSENNSFKRVLPVGMNDISNIGVYQTYPIEKNLKYTTNETYISKTDDKTVYTEIAIAQPLETGKEYNIVVTYTINNEDFKNEAYIRSMPSSLAGITGSQINNLKVNINSDLKEFTPTFKQYRNILPTDLSQNFYKKDSPWIRVLVNIILFVFVGIVLAFFLRVTMIKRKRRKFNKRKFNRRYK